MALAACATTPPPSEADAFFERLSSLCGERFAGALVSNDDVDADFRGQEMEMHVASCDDTEVRIPFRVGDDRSRTWVVTRTDAGLRLKHQHLHADGTPDAVTWYGGTATTAGSAMRQEFPVDEESIALFRREGLDASVVNVWALEVGDDMFAYELRRPTGRFFRVEFDTATPLR
ncbi:hypothetical protein WJT74_11150 [Sphingomicrobium sp. XHP0239]|uniref:hypothetical protein n=1 Tax=Sphingomicrobium maritimum TaxID=3133972 RepID=UPI0031CC4AF8